MLNWTFFFSFPDEIDRGLVVFELLGLTFIVNRFFLSGGFSSCVGPSYAVLYDAS
jgi:hypothetical protein